MAETDGIKPTTAEEGDNPPPPYDDQKESSSNESKHHDDPDLAQQESVANINNRNVRITFWCMVYIVGTISQIDSASYSHLYYSEDWNSADTAPDAADALYEDEQVEFYSWIIAAYFLLFAAATAFLSGLYLPFCRFSNPQLMDYISAALFIIGAFLLIAPLTKGIESSCEDNTSLDDKGEGNCKMNAVAGFLPLFLFSIFLGIDIIKEFGNDIKIRIIVASVILGLRAFLLFLYSLYYIDEVSDAEEIRLLDTSTWNNYTSTASLYSYRTNAAWHFIMCFICVLMLLVIALKFGLKHPLIPKFLGFIMLIAHGIVSTQLLLTGIVLMMVYDIQYFLG